MFLGRVAGTVWSTVKWPEAKGLKLLLVRPYRLGDVAPGAARAGGEASEPTDDLVVCVDTLDAGPAVSGLGPAAFAASMIAGRLLMARIANRVTGRLLAAGAPS